MIGDRNKTHKKAHEDELNQLNDLRNAIATLSQQLEDSNAQEEQVFKKLDQVRGDLSKRRQKLEQFKRDKQIQLVKNHPELNAYEERLGLKVEPLMEGEIKFTFTMIDSKDWDREYSFVLNVRE